MPINPGRILYKDDQLLAVMKLAGELVVRGKGKVEKLPLFDFLRKEFPGIHPLNRLDFETSGIVIFARNKKILAQVVDSGFKGWKKTYRTVVAGVITKPKGEITKPLPTRMTGEDAPSKTMYRVLKTFEGASYIEAEIEAGRRHQIRKHFAMIGHPLALDYLYGDKKFNNWFQSKYKFQKFFLHAYSVEFMHPVTGKKTNIVAPMPLSFEKLLEKLA